MDRLPRGTGELRPAARPSRNLRDVQRATVNRLLYPTPQPPPPRAVNLLPDSSERGVTFDGLSTAREHPPSPASRVNPGPFRCRGVGRGFDSRPFVPPLAMLPFGYCVGSPCLAGAHAGSSRTTVREMKEGPSSSAITC